MFGPHRPCSKYSKLHSGWYISLVFSQPEHRRGQKLTWHGILILGNCSTTRWHYKHVLQWRESGIYSDILSGIYTDIFCGILSCIFCVIFLAYVLARLLAFYPAFYSGIYSDILSGTYNYSHFLWHSILHVFCHMFWHTFWHSILGILFWAFYSNILFYHFIIWCIFADSCGWGLTGNTAIAQKALAVGVWRRRR